MADSRRPSNAGHKSHPVVIHLSYAQAMAVHAALTFVANHRDWADAAGSATFDLAEDAHDAIIHEVAMWKAAQDG